MKTENTPTKPATFAEVRARFQLWRETREKRTAVPEELWQAAVDLWPQHSLSKLARSLGIDYRQLKERAVDSGVLPAEQKMNTGGFGFVELGIRQTQPSREYVVELEKADGSRMRVKISGEATVDVVELAKTFWEAPR